MGLKCFNCGKGVMYGHNVSHAKNRTRKIFKPNLHSTKITVNSAQKRVKLCTKCQRLIKYKAVSKIQSKTVIKEQPQAAVI